MYGINEQLSCESKRLSSVCVLDGEPGQGKITLYIPIKNNFVKILFRLHMCCAVAIKTIKTQ